MINVLEAAPGEFALVTGNPMLTSLDGESRVSLAVILHQQREAEFGIHLLDETPPEGHCWSGGIAGAAGAPELVFTPIAITAENVIAERSRRLALGFDYDFGDERGAHRIGTTEADMRGWDEVSKGASAAIALEQPGAAIQIVTDTGPVAITALEWQQILLAAAAFRQPVWQASFVLQALDPIPASYRDDAWWP